MMIQSILFLFFFYGASAHELLGGLVLAALGKHGKTILKCWSQLAKSLETTGVPRGSYKVKGMKLQNQNPSFIGPEG